MTTIQACSFLVLGWGLSLLPLLAPGHFPPTGFDGTNTSALWLQFMGGVNGGLGAGYVARLQVHPALVRALAWRPAPLPDFLPAEILRPALNLDEGHYTDDEDRQSAAA